MRFNTNEKTAVFIDGANLSAAARSLGLQIDFSKLRDFFDENCHLVRCWYYTAIQEDENGHATIQPLVDWLSYNGYRVVTKSSKTFTRDDGTQRTKGDMDVEMSIDALESAEQLDHVVLLTGDGDFVRLVDAIQRRGVRVTTVSTTRSEPSMIADELRRLTDRFMDLEEIRPYIERRMNGNGHSHRAGTATTTRASD